MRRVIYSRGRGFYREVSKHLGAGQVVCVSCGLTSTVMRKRLNTRRIEAGVFADTYKPVLYITPRRSN